MVTVDHAIIARLTSHGTHFEILVDCENAIAYRGGAAIDLKDVVAVMKVFSDARKGLEVPAAQLIQTFKTSDPTEVIKEIIKKGEIQITAEYKHKLRETKRKQIIHIIHRNGVDPKTNLPHPLNRIEAAMEEAKIKVDEYEDVNRQVQEALKKIKVILPIKFVMKEIVVKIPPEFAAKSYSTVTSFGKKTKDEWQKDGSWVVVLEIPGGMEQDLYDKLNQICHGNIESKVLAIR